jgi:hypothetical protein
MGIAPVLAITGQNFPRYIEGYFEFFAVFKNVYVFNPFSRGIPKDGVPYRG